MNIGIYSPYLDTLTGGEKYMFTAASCLSREHKVTIFWDDPQIVQKAQKKFNLDLQNVLVEKNIFSPTTSLFKRLQSTIKFDRIFYLSDGSIPLVASKKLLVHFQFPVEWVNTNSFVFLFKKRRISKYICNSHFTKQYIDKKFNCNSFVLYPPAQTNPIKVVPKENLILTVGRYSILPNGTDFKKLQTLIEAFKKFQKKRLKGWSMAIVTSVNKDSEEEFEKFASDVNSSYIKIYKNSAYEEITDLYARSKIYWHAAGFQEDLVKFPERAEHFGMATVEAMAYGAVPIVIDAGGQREIVKSNDNGFLWNTEEELIEMTHKVATDHKLSERLSEAAKISSQKYNSDRFCEELQHLI